MPIMLKFILASQSPRRKKLLQQLGLVFEVVPSEVDEDCTESDPDALVEQLALRKANDVASKRKKGIVIGADTVVVHNDEVLGKPDDEQHACTMLERLSGQTHQVYTGVALVRSGEDDTPSMTHFFSEKTNVTFSPLSTYEIRRYAATGSPLDKAGAYGIQDDWGSVFVERIEGDYYNVVGLPLNRLYRELKQLYPEFVPSLIP